MKYVIIAAVIALSSCTKSNNTKWSCSCTISAGGGVSGQQQSIREYNYAYGSIPQSYASSKCDSQESAMKKTYGVQATSCGLQ